MTKLGKELYYLISRTIACTFDKYQIIYFFRFKTQLRWTAIILCHNVVFCPSTYSNLLCKVFLLENCLKNRIHQTHCNNTIGVVLKKGNEKGKNVLIHECSLFSCPFKKCWLTFVYFSMTFYFAISALLYKSSGQFFPNSNFSSSHMINVKT